MRNLVWVLALAAVLRAALPLSAQTPATSPAQGHADAARRAARNPYAAEPLVVERWDSVYRYNADGTGSKVDSQTVLAQTEAGVRALSILAVPYAAGRERAEIVAVRVIKRNGTTVSTPPGEAQDQPAPVTLASPGYSDFHLLRLGVRGLAAGDRLEYEVKTEFTAAQAKDAFWGSESLRPGRVVLARHVEVRVPAATSLAIHSEGPPVQTTTEAGSRVYRWSAAQKVSATALQDAGGAAAAVDEEHAPLDSGTARLAWSTFPSWAAVGEWYRGRLTGMTAVTPEIKSKADAVVYRARTPDARIAALYRYVSSEVRSINAPLAVGTYQPQAAAVVLANQYGDSQDKHALLDAMLHAENLPSAAALAGTADDLDEAVPAPLWFDRVLTLSHDVEHGDVWLDATPEFAPYRMLQRSLRGKLALVIPATGTPELRRTPADAPFPEYTQFEASGTLTAEGTLQAHVQLAMRGDEELIYREGLRDAGPTRWDQVAGYYVRTAGMQGLPGNTTVEGTEATEAPLRIGFDFSREVYGDWGNFRILPLEPRLSLPLTERRVAPASEFALGGKRTESAVSRLALPVGFGADLPPAVHLHTAFASLDKSYRLERAGDAQVLVTDRTLAITADTLPVSAWPEYRAFLDAVAKSEPYVQLTSAVAHSGPGHFPPPSGESSPAAAELVYGATQAVDAEDWKRATTKLDEAKALNPRQTMLWREYAAVALGTGHPDEAMEDDRQELRNHPAEGQVSRHLAALLVRAGKTDEAMAVLGAATTANPQDERSARFLADLQLGTDAPGAERTMRAALKASPDSLAVKLELGRVLVREGKRDEAAGLLQAVANGSDDPEQLNDAAYELAGANLNLRVAEAAARRAVQLLNAASSHGLIGVTSAEARLLTAQLIAAWDTYGWVLFTEGSTSEAEPWLRAAWVDGFGTAAGTHYAKLLAKEGRTAEASRVQALAAEGEHGSVDEATDERVRVPTKGRRGAKTEGGDNEAMDGERSFPVARVGTGPNGTALFDVDYALGFVTVAHFVNGDAALAPMAENVAKVDTHLAIPPGSTGHLVRRGTLTCGADAVCRLRLLAPLAAVAQP